jgi:DHA2 family multidrug resistance protein
MIARLTQVNHASLVEHISPLNPLLRNVMPPGASHSQIAQVAVALDAEISRQAAMIAYIDVFRLGAFALLVTAVLTLLTRRAVPGNVKMATVDA